MSADTQRRDIDLDMEDERFVEDLLIPSPSSPATSYSMRFGQPHSPPALTSAARARSPTFSRKPLHNTGDSSFTSTDPFYLAQVQAMQNAHQPTHSVFSQLGKPAQHSPFMVNATTSQQQPNQAAMAFESSPHQQFQQNHPHFLVAGSPGFNFDL